LNGKCDHKTPRIGILGYFKLIQHEVRKLAKNMYSFWVLLFSSWLFNAGFFYGFCIHRYFFEGIKQHNLHCYFLELFKKSNTAWFSIGGASSANLLGNGGSFAAREIGVVGTFTDSVEVSSTSIIIGC
jgi:hypothetical protein